MNNSVPMSKDNEKFIKFNQGLDVVNDDWPLLGEINQNKFIINKKHQVINIAKTAKEIIENDKKEEREILTNTVSDETEFEDAFLTSNIKNEKDFVVSPKLNEEVVVKASEPTNRTDLVKKIITPSQVSNPTKLIVSKEKVIKTEVLENNTLIKLIIIGLSKLYLKKTTVVLNPVKFVGENYKNILVALLHLGMPILMSWFLVTQISFIKVQMAQEPAIMFWTYSLLFYFASLFTWVSAQVILAGVLSMFKTTLVSVAKNVDTNN